MAVVGFYHDVANSHDAFDEITAAGHTRVDLLNIDATSLANIDILYAWRGNWSTTPSNDLANAINNGLNVVIFDRNANNAFNFPWSGNVPLPGFTNSGIASTSNDVEITAAGLGYFGTGVGGTVTQTTLDMNNASFGYIDVNDMPPGATILSHVVGNPNQVTGLTYTHGAGQISYFTLNSPAGSSPSGGNIFDGFATNLLTGALVCFAAGTLIKTQSGEVAIEDLSVGDMVLTMDHGPQPIRWIGSSKRPAIGKFAPILIRKGALGNTRDLRVSPQHRMLLSGWHAEVLFGESEVLATAKSLVNDHSILREEGGEVGYFHMLFDTHEIVYAEGAPSESFHPGPEGWKALDAPTRNEILELFPQLANGNFDSYGPSARASLKYKEGSLLSHSMISQTQH